MKKGILLLLLFISVNGFAQQKDTLPVQLNYGGITITGTLIIPHQGTSSGVSSVNGKTGVVTIAKADVGLSLADNTADINKIISIPVQNAFNNVMNQLAQKQNLLVAGNNIQITGNVISATGGSGGNPFPYTQTDSNFQYTVRLPDDGKVYSDGVGASWNKDGFSSYWNVNSDGRPNNVYIPFGYNCTRQGDHKNPLEAAIMQRWESNYTIQAHNPFFEAHWILVNIPGIGEVRIASAYISKVTGQAFLEYTANSYAVFEPGYTDKNLYSPWMNSYNGFIDLSSVHVGRGTGIRMKDVATGVTVELTNIGGVPSLKVPGVFDGNAYGHVKVLAPVYSDDATAKSAGLVIGDNFWITINGRKFLTQVQ
jgi:hypothetical protein